MIHIIQNDPEVSQGNIAANLDLPFRLLQPYCEEQLPHLEDITALIILGGAMGANDDWKHPFLTKVKSLIRQTVNAGIPCLGICLGGQLLAAALGAKVVANRWQELGTLPVKLTSEGESDKLFTGISGQFPSFQWHNDSFDLPPGAELLASSERCPHQAFRIGNSAWGLQFHPEVTTGIVKEWCTLAKVNASKTEKLLAEFAIAEPIYINVARHLLHNFLHSANLL